MFLVVKKNLKKVKASKFKLYKNKAELHAAFPRRLRDNNELLVPEDPSGELMIRLMPQNYKNFAIIYEGDDFFAYPVDFEILAGAIAQKYKLRDVVGHSYSIAWNKVLVTNKTKYGALLHVTCIIVDVPEELRDC